MESKMCEKSKYLDELQDLSWWQNFIFYMCESAVTMLCNGIMVSIIIVIVWGILLSVGLTEVVSFAIGSIVGVVLTVVLILCYIYYWCHLKGNVYFEDEGVWR